MKKPEIDKIKQLKPEEVDNAMQQCPECQKIDQILACKKGEGDEYGDYLGGITFKKQGDKLVDSSGMFIGKDCDCSKEDIPKIGKLTDIGLFQDKDIDPLSCSKQALAMEKVYSAAKNQSTAENVSASNPTSSVSPNEAAGGSSTGGGAGQEAMSSADATSSMSAGEGSPAGGSEASAGSNETSTGNMQNNIDASQEKPLPAVSQVPFSQQPTMEPAMNHIPPSISIKAIKIKYEDCSETANTTGNNSSTVYKASNETTVAKAETSSPITVEPPRAVGKDTKQGQKTVTETQMIMKTIIKVIEGPNKESEVPISNISRKELNMTKKDPEDDVTIINTTVMVDDPKDIQCEQQCECYEENCENPCERIRCVA